MSAEPVVPLAAALPGGFPTTVGRPLPRHRARYFRAHADEGAWVHEYGRERVVDARFDEARRAAGITAAAYAPVVHEGRTIGILGCLTAGADGGERLARRLGSLIEIAAHGAPLLAPAAARSRARRERPRRAPGEHRGGAVPPGLPAHRPARRSLHRRLRGPDPVRRRRATRRPLRRGCRAGQRARAGGGHAPGRGVGGGGPPRGRVAVAQRVRRLRPLRPAEADPRRHRPTRRHRAHGARRGRRLRRPFVAPWRRSAAACGWPSTTRAPGSPGSATSSSSARAW